MIRSALIALGLSACGLSAGAAVPPLVDAAAHTAECGVQVDTTEHADAEQASELDTVQPDPVRTTPDGDASIGVALDHAVARVDGVTPFDPDVTAVGVIDGSDPSSDFCP